MLSVLLEGGTHYPIRQGWSGGGVETGKASGEGFGLALRNAQEMAIWTSITGTLFTWTFLTT